MSETVFQNFVAHFPFTAEKVASWDQINSTEILLRLENGEELIFDEMDKTLRTLPPDKYSLSEEQCRNEFGIRLRKTLQRCNMSQLELSEITGIYQPQISNYISGKSTPSFYNVDKIAKALGCSVDELRYC